MAMAPLDTGKRFIETLWYAFADRIVTRAIEIYGVSDEKAVELKEKFLKRGNYVVQTYPK